MLDFFSALYVILISFYIIGMTDLLAPLLAVLDDRVEAFWCFTKLMDFRAVCRPGKNQESVKHQLVHTSLVYT